MNAFEWSKAYFRSEDRSLHETKATMAALMTFADFDDLTCYPSQRTLAQITGTHVDTIRRHIKKNAEAGWLVKLEQGNSYKSSTRYQLTVPTPRIHAGSQHSQLPVRVQGVKPSTPRTGARGTPRTDAGSTPCTGAPLTTHVTNQITTHKGGSRKLPHGSARDDLPSDATNQVPTPCTDAGSSGSTDAGSPFGPRLSEIPKTYTDPKTGEERVDPFAT